MKKLPVVFAFALGSLLPALPSPADGPFNPPLSRIESPRDDGDAAVRRLTIDAGGKTPTAKNLDPAWIKALADRGEPTLSTKDNSSDFDYIGMPVGGIGAGELYLSGDGRLWDWDIFGTLCKPGFPVEQGLAYRTPHAVGNPADAAQIVLDQGFVIRTKQGDKVDTRTLDKNGFSDVTFSGQYPVGSVNYTDPSSPVHVHLDAYSPFIPGDVADSSYPATILTYTIENTSKDPVECTIGGWMENATGIKVRKLGAILLDNTAAAGKSYQAVNYTMKLAPSDTRPPETFDDFESGKYDKWTTEGDAFGTQPAGVIEFKHQFPVLGNAGNYFVDSYIDNSDKATGKLTSSSFVIDRPFMTFAVGGGADPTKEFISLLIDGKVVRSASGQNDENLRETNWDLRPFAGKTAQVQIVDNSSGGWGHIMVDNIAFADLPYPLADQSDVGDMTLALLGDGSVTAQITGDSSSNACLDAAPSPSAELKTSGDTDKLVERSEAPGLSTPGPKRRFRSSSRGTFPIRFRLGLRRTTADRRAVASSRPRMWSTTWWLTSTGSPPPRWLGAIPGTTRRCLITFWTGLS